MLLVNRGAVIWMCRVAAALVLGCVALEAGAPPVICDVTSAGDSGAGTLREKIGLGTCNEINIKVAGPITISTRLATQNSMVINGNGQVVNGNNVTGVFEIASTHVVTINNMTIANGNATYGAGIYNHGDLTLNNCTLTGNTSTSAGGAIASDTGSLTIKNSTLTGNSSATGGAIANASPSATLIHVTLVENNASSSGGGISNGTSGHLTITNSIVAGNTASTAPEISYAGTLSLTSTGKNIFGISGVLGIIGATPDINTYLTPAGGLTTVVGSLTNNGGPTQTRAPVYGGTASNAGDNAAAVSANLEYDQRGGWRILDSAVDIGAVEIGTVPLNDTGIQFCGAYPSGNNYPCLGTEPAGQDAHYGTNSFDFTAIDSSGNATTPTSGATPHPCVLDNVTGLIWEVKTDDSGLRDKDNTYSWYNSTAPDGNKGTANGGTCFASGSGCDTEKYVADVNAAGLCGFNDWRMPSKKELFGIVDFGRYNPAIDPTYFPNTNSSWFWSGSPDAGNSDLAWYVNFYNGYADYDYRYYSFRVRLVRGGQ